MADVLMISVSGVRGLIGRTMTPQVATEFGQAFGAFLVKNPGPGAAAGPLAVAIGRDSRPSGPMVQAALTAGLLSVGVNVIDLGVATTPGVALMGRFLKTAASVVITASHNPLEWNGIKFLRHDGVAFPPTDAAVIKQSYFDKNWTMQEIAKLGRYSTDSRTHAQHVQRVLAVVDAKGIAEQRYKVVLDSVNGAGCVATPTLLSKLGAEMAHMNGEATGNFAHTPEPTKENLTGLCDEVKRRGAAVGFAQDPDADRLAIVDEHGAYIGEEYTLALATLARLSVKPGPVVANLSTSRMVDDLARRFNCEVFRSAVGEANVAAKMMEVGAVIGGEGNGGVIDPRVGPVRDSFVGIALVLEHMARTKKTISALVAEIPAYTMVKSKFPCTPEEAASLVNKARTAFAGARMDTTDGARIDTPEGWVHVRPSNTEPIARVIAEGATHAAAEALVQRVMALR